MNKVAILGGGESGVGAALLAKQKTLDVFLSDAGRIHTKYKNELLKHEVEFEESGHTASRLLLADIIVKSPGIPGDIPFLKEAAIKGIPVISELEFAFLNGNEKIIAITGSNGKTTTSLLVHHILKFAGNSVAVAGNIGKSYSRVLAEGALKDIMVLEVSSFQLDDIRQFKPDIAVLLNISADHLDRYGGKIENYIHSKLRIQQYQDKEDLFIYNEGDDYILNYLDFENLHQKKIGITMPVNISNSLQLSSGVEIDISSLKLKGRHNVFNVNCAAEVCLACGVPAEMISNALESFNNHPHRMELFAVINGIKFMDDSKATNVESASFALEASEGELIWIAGGTDKGNKYSVLQDLVKNKVKAMICLGVNTDVIASSFSEFIPVIVKTKTMEEAVRTSMEYASEGDTVLLSPACASFDLFDNYIHRGKRFKEEVFNLLRK